MENKHSITLVVEGESQTFDVPYYYNYIGGSLFIMFNEQVSPTVTLTQAQTDIIRDEIATVIKGGES